jgi:hypothetical protein
MKKFWIVLFVVLFAVTPVFAVDFGDTDYKVIFKDGELRIAGKKIMLKVNAKTGEVTKLIPETWKTIAGSSGHNWYVGSGSILTISGTSAGWITVRGPEEKHKKKTEQVGPFTVTYYTPKRELTVTSDDLDFFFLRLQNCGQVEKLEWKEINKNEE